MLIGILIASLFTVVGAVSIGAPWQIVPTGVLAGIMASVEASKVHEGDGEVVAVLGEVDVRRSDNDETHIVKSNR